MRTRLTTTNCNVKIFRAFFEANRTQELDVSGKCRPTDFCGTYVSATAFVRDKLDIGLAFYPDLSRGSER